VTPPPLLPFRFFLRVRYGECDAQGVVFNARWGDYVDVAVTEYFRTLFGAAAPDNFDMKLVKQTLEWHAGARFDDIVDCRVSTLRIGTTSFAVQTHFFRDTTHLATAETVYVAVDKAGAKQPVRDAERRALERGAPGVVVDHAGAMLRA
jgi:acyl-CoA thioester hydrolase